jgi:hypothetical protein
MSADTFRADEDRGRRMTARYLRGLGDTSIVIYLERLVAGQPPAELVTSTVSFAELSAAVCPPPPFDASL